MLSSKVVKSIYKGFNASGLCLSILSSLSSLNIGAEKVWKENIGFRLYFIVFNNRQLVLKWPYGCGGVHMVQWVTC